MSLKEFYEKKLQAQLDEWAAEIDKFSAKAARASASTQSDYYKRVAQLRKKESTLEIKLGELRGASDDAWEDLKDGIHIAWDSMTYALRDAANHFK
ncbi:coiled coil domain-containing protein [bacterium]|nr:coiled coil domain-containing protein [bacterium]